MSVVVVMVIWYARVLLFNDELKVRRFGEKKVPICALFRTRNTYHMIAYWKPSTTSSSGKDTVALASSSFKDDDDEIDANNKRKKSTILETIDFPPSAYVRFNANALEKLNRLDEDVRMQKTATRAEVTSYKRREPKERGPFVVGLTDAERERIKEQFYVVEVFYEDVRRTRRRRRRGEEGEEEEVERRSEKFVFATTKENYEIEELKETNAEEYVKDSGCRFHEVQYARRFVCKEVTAIDDEAAEEAEEEAKEKTNKRTKQRYAVRIGRVEDARAGSRMVCGSVVEVRRLDFVSDGGCSGGDVGDDKATKRQRSEKDAEKDRNKLLRVLEKITATAEGILADERRDDASAEEAGEEGAGAAPAGGEKSGEFVDATAKWTLRNATTDAFDVHPAAMYCALIASVNLEQ